MEKKKASLTQVKDIDSIELDNSKNAAVNVGISIDNDL